MMLSIIKIIIFFIGLPWIVHEINQYKPSNYWGFPHGPPISRKPSLGASARLRTLGGTLHTGTQAEKGDVTGIQAKSRDVAQNSDP